MKKEICEVSNGIMRITTIDERWYARPKFDPVTGLPSGYEFVPSTTWICEYYPKGIGFYKWLANTGWDEAQAIKEAAGDKGSKIHHGNNHLMDGMTITHGASILNPSSGQLEPVTTEEYAALWSFTNWFDTITPTIVDKDVVVWNDEEHYAGTVDVLYTLPEDSFLHLDDFKTSKFIWPSHRLQVSAYKHTKEIEALVKTLGLSGVKLGILQLGYERNKIGYKHTEIEDCYPLFLSIKQIWAEETKGQQPSQKDYPLSLALSRASAPSSTTALGRMSGDSVAEPTTGGDDGGTERLGEEKQQDAHPGRRGNRRGDVSRVQNRDQSV